MAEKAAFRRGDALPERGKRLSVVRDIYQGYALQAIDRKGRVAIPHALRAVIEANSGQRLLLIGDHQQFPCMIAYDRNWSRLLYDRVEREHELARAAGEKVDRSNSGLHNFANVDEVTFDEAGRFILPEYVMFRAKLDDVAFFAGDADTFQVWNPKILLDTPEVEEGLRDRCRWLMAKRGVA